MPQSVCLSAHALSTKMVHFMAMVTIGNLMLEGELTNQHGYQPEVAETTTKPLAKPL